jgi:hypothetical protein
MGFGSDFANNSEGGGGAIIKSLGAPDLLSALQMEEVRF